MTITKLIRKCFLAKEIVSQEGELHFRRWRIFETPVLSLYYHQIFRSDEDRHCHNHPWNFISLILSGGYLEYDQTESLGFKEFLPGSINYHRAKDFHHLSLVKPTTTLVLTFGTRRPWGYYVDGKMIPHKEYRYLKRQGKV